MNAEERTNSLFDEAKRVGMTNYATGDGLPSRSMVAEAISEAEWDTEETFKESIGKALKIAAPAPDLDGLPRIKDLSRVELGRILKAEIAKNAIHQTREREIRKIVSR